MSLAHIDANRNKTVSNGFSIRCANAFFIKKSQFYLAKKNCIIYPQF